MSIRLSLFVALLATVGPGQIFAQETEIRGVYQPPIVLPIAISVNQNGQVGLGVTKTFVTPIGTFSIESETKKSLSSEGTYVIIRVNKSMSKKYEDNVFHLAGSGEIRARSKGDNELSIKPFPKYSNAIVITPEKTSGTLEFDFIPNVKSTGEIASLEAGDVLLFENGGLAFNRRVFGSNLGAYKSKPSVEKSRIKDIRFYHMHHTTGVCFNYKSKYPSKLPEGCTNVYYFPNTESGKLEIAYFKRCATKIGLDVKTVETVDKIKKEPSGLYLFSDGTVADDFHPYLSHAEADIIPPGINVSSKIENSSVKITYNRTQSREKRFLNGDDDIGFYFGAKNSGKIRRLLEQMESLRK